MVAVCVSSPIFISSEPLSSYPVILLAVTTPVGATRLIVVLAIPFICVLALAFGW